MDGDRLPRLLVAGPSRPVPARPPVPHRRLSLLACLRAGRSAVDVAAVQPRAGTVDRPRARLPVLARRSLDARPRRAIGRGMDERASASRHGRRRRARCDPTGRLARTCLHEAQPGGWLGLVRLPRRVASVWPRACAACRRGGRVIRARAGPVAPMVRRAASEHRRAGTGRLRAIGGAAHVPAPRGSRLARLRRADEPGVAGSDRLRPRLAGPVDFGVLRLRDCRVATTSG